MPARKQTNDGAPVKRERATRRTVQFVTTSFLPNEAVTIHELVERVRLDTPDLYTPEVARAHAEVKRALEAHGYDAPVLF